MSSPIYFLKVVKLLIYKSSLPSLKLSQGIFEAIVKETVSMISFSVCLSFIYWKAADFLLYLYLATFLKIFIR